MLRYPRRTLRSSFIIRCIDTFGYVVSLKLEVDHFPGFPGGKEERGKSGWASLAPSPDPPTTFLPEQVCGWSFVCLYLPLHNPKGVAFFHRGGLLSCPLLSAPGLT